MNFDEAINLELWELVARRFPLIEARYAEIAVTALGFRQILQGYMDIKIQPIHMILPNYPDYLATAPDGLALSTIEKSFWVLANSCAEDLSDAAFGQFIVIVKDLIQARGNLKGCLGGLLAAAAAKPDRQEQIVKACTEILTHHAADIDMYLLIEDVMALATHSGNPETRLLLLEAAPSKAILVEDIPPALFHAADFENPLQLDRLYAVLTGKFGVAAEDLHMALQCRLQDYDADKFRTLRVLADINNLFSPADSMFNPATLTPGAQEILEILAGDGYEDDVMIFAQFVAAKIVAPFLAQAGAAQIDYDDWLEDKVIPIVGQVMFSSINDILNAIDKWHSCGEAVSNFDEARQLFPPNMQNISRNDFEKRILNAYHFAPALSLQQRPSFFDWDRSGP